MQALQTCYKQLEMKLACRLHRRYRISKQSIEIARNSYSNYLVDDTNQVLEQAAALELLQLSKPIDRSSSCDPFWAQHWSCSVAMATQWHSLIPKEYCYLASELRVLELGSGSGLLSVCMAKAGIDVLATDISGDALLLTKLNGYANGLSIRTHQLDWHTVNSSLPSAKENFLFGVRKFQCIVGSDIAYERQSFDALENVLLRFGTDHSTAIFAEPYRSSGDQFIEHLLHRGWHIHIVDSNQLLHPTKEHVRYIYCSTIPRHLSSYPKK